jgi:hypothetical protein
MAVVCRFVTHPAPPGVENVSGIVNLTGCGQGDAHREAACANNYAAVITLLISAQTRNVCVLEALCSAAVR